MLTTVAALELADGTWIFGIVLGVLLLALIESYTVRGSGIFQRPYARRYTSAPGAQRQPRLGGSDGDLRGWSRGTR